MVRALGALPASILAAVFAVSAPARAEEPPSDVEQPSEAGEAQRTNETEEVEPEGAPEEPLPEDLAPDALRDPILSKIIKRRFLVDKPGFSVEVGGRIQVQYYDADKDDPDNEDEVFLRRVRPYLLGHLGESWTWKFEAELGADIEAGEIDLDQLDIRDMYMRYEGFEASGRRLTIGNQKAPYSRDFLAPNTHLLLIERTFAGQFNTGVPGRVLGVHFRDALRDGKLSFSATVGALGHTPDVNRLRFDTLIFGSGNLNEGYMVTGRMDVQPRGAVTFSDSDPHTPELRHAWSVAAFAWENTGKNRFTEGGFALDPERADLDSAIGLELSGGLRGLGIMLDWEVRRVEGDTVVNDFTGGIYLDGETRLDVAGVEGAYWIPGSIVELGGALARTDTDAYTEAWDSATAVLNLHMNEQLNSKLQITHTWTWSRFGLPGEDFRETRIQYQYVW